MKPKSILALLLLALVLVSGGAITRFVLFVFADKNYASGEACLDGNRNCGSITIENRGALDSGVKKFIYFGDWITLPVFNSNYVMFDDGVEFWLMARPNGRYDRYATAPPVANNLADLVMLSNVAFGESPCRDKSL